MLEKVKVVDVTARDGLQNEPKAVSTRDKLKLIESLVQAGVKDIQATSLKVNRKGTAWKGVLPKKNLPLGKARPLSSLNNRRMIFSMPASGSRPRVPQTSGEAT